MQNIHRSSSRNWPSATRAARPTSGRRATIINAALWVAVALLYGQFVVTYGLNYRGNYTVDLPSFYTASIATFKLNLSPYSLATLNHLMSDQQVYSYLYPPQSLLL